MTCGSLWKSWCAVHDGITTFFWEEKEDQWFDCSAYSIFRHTSKTFNGINWHAPSRVVVSVFLSTYTNSGPDFTSRKFWGLSRGFLSIKIQTIAQKLLSFFSDQIFLKKLPFFLYNLAQISNLSNGLNHHITQVWAGIFTDLPKTWQNNNPWYLI